MRSNEFFEKHPVFSRREYLEARLKHGSTERTADNLLAKHLAAKRIVRVRRGLYATVPIGVNPAKVPVDPYLLATKLAPDAVVAHHAALQFHGKAHSLWNRFHYTSRHRGRRFHFRGMEFVPVLLPDALCELSGSEKGVMEVRHAGGIVRVTSLERTLVDIMYSPDKSGGWEEIWRSLETVGFVDLDQVVGYAQMLGSAICAARIGLFLEEHRDELMVEERHLNQLRKLSPKQARYLDSRREPGRLVDGWNLVVSERIINHAWGEVL